MPRIYGLLNKSHHLFCISFKVYNGSTAGLRMVGVTLHQSSVIVANLYLALITAQWVSTNNTHVSDCLKYCIFELRDKDLKPLEITAVYLSNLHCCEIKA